MEIGSIIGAIIGVALGTVVYGILIWIVGKLGLGLKVDGFPSALLAGLLVAMDALVQIDLRNGFHAPFLIDINQMGGFHAVADVTPLVDGGHCVRVWC